MGIIISRRDFHVIPIKRYSCCVDFLIYMVFSKFQVITNTFWNGFWLPIIYQPKMLIFDKQQQKKVKHIRHSNGWPTAVLAPKLSLKSIFFLTTSFFLLLNKQIGSYSIHHKKKVKHASQLNVWVSMNRSARSDFRRKLKR